MFYILSSYNNTSR